MVDGIVEVGIRWERSELDPVVDVILDSCIGLTKCEVNPLLVAHKSTSKRATVTAE
jgi:hypothetical protein